ncbi:MAG: hypothetical protein G8D24_00645 [Buchnera aphidicola (Periphyllus lyropictus)]|uniref:prephenate dehydratase domain-containing protein n=1 Tax=Buchnera aphidicola TaxID=9 RepID=UPI001EBC46D5|nr:hypothetical protein [Buchnera aphidicola (Periphyllus lyropictus)]
MIKISFLGPKGSYSYLAALKYAKKRKKIFYELPCKNFKKILKNIKKKKSKYAIFPIKNSVSGKINEIKKFFKKKNFFIKEKIIIPIQHCIISKKKISLNNIKKIYSHTQPIKQCKSFLKKFPNWKIKYTNSSSEAVKKISLKKKNNVAAIGNKKCKKLYNLYLIKENISDQKNNKTTFYIVSKK